MIFDANGGPGGQFTTRTSSKALKRTLSLNSEVSESQSQVNPHNCTEFIQDLQPTDELAPLGYPPFLSIPDSFTQRLFRALYTKLGKQKSPGRDMIK